MLPGFCEDFLCIDFYVSFEYSIYINTRSSTRKTSSIEKRYGGSDHQQKTGRTWGVLSTRLLFCLAIANPILILGHNFNVTMVTNLAC